MKDHRSKTKMRLLSLLGIGGFVVLAGFFVGALPGPMPAPQKPGRAAPAPAGSLLARWALDEVSDRTVTDSVSGAGDKLAGNYRLTPGVSGQAVKFDGYTTVVTRTADRAPVPAGGFSVSAWIALAAYPWNWCPVVCHQEANAGWSLEIGPDGELAMKVFTGTIWRTCVSEAVLPLRAWVHVAGTFDPETGLTVLVDGRENARLPFRGRLSAALRADLLIGSTAAPLKPALIHREFGTLPDDFTAADGSINPNCYFIKHADVGPLNELGTSKEVAATVADTAAVTQNTELVASLANIAFTPWGPAFLPALGQPTSTLKIGIEAGAGTTSPAAGSHIYATGTEVRISVTPKTDYRFSYWSGNVMSYQSSFSIVMDGDKEIMASLSGGPIEKWVDEHCFIATAAYGDPSHPHVKILREFRDRYLIRSPLGRSLVDLYYRYSPPVARFVEKHPTLKAISRAALYPAVALSYVLLLFK